MFLLNTILGVSLINNPKHPLIFLEVIKRSFIKMVGHFLKLSQNEI